MNKNDFYNQTGIELKTKTQGRKPEPENVIGVLVEPDNMTVLDGSNTGMELSVCLCVLSFCLECI